MVDCCCGLPIEPVDCAAICPEPVVDEVSVAASQPVVIARGPGKGSAGKGSAGKGSAVMLGWKSLWEEALFLRSAK